jgi:hypothetical protein
MVCEEHDIATRCPHVHNVCPMLHIVSGEVKLKEPMVVFAVILNEHKIMHIPFQAYGWEQGEIAHTLMVGLPSFCCKKVGMCTGDFWDFPMLY